MKDGVTFIEIMLVVGMVLILVALSGGIYGRFLLQNATGNTADVIAGELRRAQIYAIMGRQSSNWGVSYSGGVVALYKGGSYADRVPSMDETYSSNENVTVTPFDFNFSRLSGLPVPAGGTITVTSGNTTRVITINPQGVVSNNATVGMVPTATPAVTPAAPGPGSLSGSGMVVYGSVSNSGVGHRYFDPGTGLFGPVEQSQMGGNGINYVVKASPIRKEAVVAKIDVNGVFSVWCSDGGGWAGPEWSLSAPQLLTRAFDAAYETSSGDVMVLYSNGNSSSELSYRVKPGTAGCGGANWSAPVSFDSPGTNGAVRWVKTAWDRRPNSNLVAAIWADSNLDLQSAVWDGSSWYQRAGPLETALERSSAVAGSDPNVESFDVDFESASGDIMVVWGSGGSHTTNGAYYAECVGGAGSCTWGAKTPISGLANDATNLDVSANPAAASNEIVFASIGDGGSDLQAAYWNGSDWMGQNDIDGSAKLPDVGTKKVATGWLVTSGGLAKSVVVYHDTATNSNCINGFVGTGSSFVRQGGGGCWFTPTPVLPNDQERFDIQMDPINREQLIFTVAEDFDENAIKLYAKRLTMNQDGTFGVAAWTNADGGAALGTGLWQSENEPFSFAYWRRP